MNELKGVIFAAGLGTRLGQLTQTRPKALVEVQGRSMLYRVLDRLRLAGIQDYVVNVHAFADQVEEALQTYARQYGVRIDVSDERDCLLETGGGLKKMAPLLDNRPVLIHNVDILSDLDLSDFVAAARREDALALLAVRRTQSDRYFLFNGQGRLCGWENVKTGQQKISREEAGLERFGFMGIHYVSPRLLPLLEETGAFSITDAYLRIARTQDISLYDASGCSWVDIGSPEQWQRAQTLPL